LFINLTVGSQAPKPSPNAGALQQRVVKEISLRRFAEALKQHLRNEKMKLHVKHCENSFFKCSYVCARTRDRSYSNLGSNIIYCFEYLLVIQIQPSFLLFTDDALLWILLLAFAIKDFLTKLPHIFSNFI